MPRVALSDSSKYSSGGGSMIPYFSLKNDKDTADVRFMIEEMGDLNNTNFVVHEVEVGDKTRYVNCLREYDSPKDDCPFCAAGMPICQVLYIPVYDVEEKVVKIWQRSPSFAQKKITGLVSRYKNFPSHIFEIERNGKARDPQTTYDIYESGHDDITLDDLPEVPELLGMVIMDRSYEDMEYYLDSGDSHSFPPTDDDEEDVKPRRRGHDEQDEEEEEEAPRRRHSRDDEEKPRRRNVSARKEDKF